MNEDSFIPARFFKITNSQKPRDAIKYNLKASNCIEIKFFVKIPMEEKGDTV